MGSTFNITVHIDSPPERVWAVMSDIERWHEWTASVTSVERLDGGPFAVGSRARIRQPKLQPAEFVVTELEAGRGFTWETKSPGARVVASHWIETVGSGSQVTLLLKFSGLVGPTAAYLMRKTINQYLEMEANGLKKRCESS
jgi:uncharacterized protein YndB with AHSA1/START domain